MKKTRQLFAIIMALVMILSVALVENPKADANKNITIVADQTSTISLDTLDDTSMYYKDVEFTPETSGVYTITLSTQKTEDVSKIADIFTDEISLLNNSSLHLSNVVQGVGENWVSGEMGMIAGQKYQFHLCSDRITFNMLVSLKNAYTMGQAIVVPWKSETSTKSIQKNVMYPIAFSGVGKYKLTLKDEGVSYNLYDGPVINSEQASATNKTVLDTSIEGACTYYLMCNQDTELTISCSLHFVVVKESMNFREVTQGNFYMFEPTETGKYAICNYDVYEDGTKLYSDTIGASSRNDIVDCYQLEKDKTYYLKAVSDSALVEKLSQSNICKPGANTLSKEKNIVYYKAVDEVELFLSAKDDMEYLVVGGDADNAKLSKGDDLYVVYVPKDNEEHTLQVTQVTTLPFALNKKTTITNSYGATTNQYKIKDLPTGDYKLTVLNDTRNTVVKAKGQKQDTLFNGSLDITVQDEEAYVDYYFTIYENDGSTRTYTVLLSNNQYVDPDATTASTTTASTVTTAAPVTQLKKQTITTAKIKSYKAKNLKKKKITFSLKAKTTGDGKLTYKVTKYPKKAKKCISVSKSGKVTLKKKAKKGIYKIKITAAKTATFEKATKTVSIKVK